MDTTNQKYDNSYKNVVKINSIIKYFYIIGNKRKKESILYIFIWYNQYYRLENKEWDYDFIAVKIFFWSMQ